MSSDKDLERYTFMVIEDFLKQNGMEDSLETFRKDKEKVIEPNEEEDIRVWFDLGEKLDLHKRFIPDCGSILEQLLSHMKKGYNPLHHPVSVTLRSLRSSNQPENENFQLTSSYQSTSHQPSPVMFSSSSLTSSSSHSNGSHSSRRRGGKRGSREKRRRNQSLQQSSTENLPSIRSQLSNPNASNSGAYESIKKGKTSSQENWIPEYDRYRMFHRSLNVTQTNWDNTLMCRDLMRRVFYNSIPLT